MLRGSVRARREIRISSSVITDTKNLETTLLHEMIHAKSGPFHARKFMGELERIRAMGAFIEEPRISKSNASQFIEEAMLEKLPRNKIPMYLEWQFQKPLAEIRKKVDVYMLIQKKFQEIKEINRIRKKVGFPPL